MLAAQRRQLLLALDEQGLDAPDRLALAPQLVIARAEIGPGATERLPGLGEVLFQAREIGEPLVERRGGLAMPRPLLFERGPRFVAVAPGGSELILQRRDPGAALGALALQPADRHIAPAELLHRAGLGREAAFGLLLRRPHPQRELGAQMVAIGGDLGQGQGKGGLGSLARQAVGAPRQGRHGGQREQPRAEEAEREQHGGFDQDLRLLLRTVLPRTCHALPGKDNPRMDSTSPGG
ncbi:hypothetical protein BTHI11S_03130 [Bosea thiooxidans]